MMRDATKAKMMRNATKAKKKISYVIRLCDLLEEYRQILIVSADNVGSKQLQGIRQCLRVHSVVVMGKNTLMKISIRLYAEKTGNDNLKKLADELIGNVGLIFTKGDLKEVIEEIGKYTVGAPARVGLVAPIDVVVPPGNTGLDPSQTSFFQVLNIPTKINKGTVEIITPVELIKVGEKVGSSEVALLAKLGIRPFSYGLIIRRVYDNGSVFDPAVLDLTEDDLLEKFSIGVSMVVALSLAISYPTLAAAPHMLINGYKNILAIALATDYDYPLAEKVKQYHKDPSKFAVADEKYGTNLLLMADTVGSSHGSGSNNSNKEFTIPECLGAKYKRCLYIPTYTRNSIAGTPLAEVVSISVYPTVKCEVYGEIWVEDDKGLVDYLFKFDREKSKLISRGSYDNCLLLCQSFRTILATRFFKVHFDLKDGDSIFLKETFSWYTTTGEDYDMLLDKTISGEYGSVKMSYIVHSLAIEAHMWSIFYKSATVTSSITVKVTICVCYKNSGYDFDDSDGLLEYTRFKIFEESELEMKANEVFLLNRKVIAVPLYYPLKIEVDLQLHGDGDGDGGSQVLCHGNVEFSSTEIETWPTVEKYIEGATGCMVVSVRGLNYARLSFDAIDGLKYRAGLKDGVEHPIPRDDESSESSD